MKRRRALAGGGIALLAGLSGCTLPFTDQGTKLLGVKLINQSGEQITVDVEVLRGEGNRVYSGTHVLNTETSVSLNCTWTLDPGEFTIILENESERIGFRDDRPRCAYVSIEVQPVLSEIMPKHVEVEDNCERESSCR